MANIVFVDKDDNPVGAGSKQEAVDQGIVHRIVRVFLYNSKGEMLIQRRSEHISSMPGLWDHSA
ncbi:MAG: isopentenyl-diphosphate delta-isomerase, partial [Patescibacteria group bacterium]|nr:isopentenyl-diphosphate delta-isomerase [Patescibacteria group bacterium]